MIRLWKPASTIRGSCAPRLSDCSSLVVFNGLFQTSGYGQIRAQSTDPLRATSTASEWFVLNPRLEQKINYITKLYEDFIGLTEVKAAQAKVSTKLKMQKLLAVDALTHDSSVKCYLRYGNIRSLKITEN